MPPDSVAELAAQFERLAALVGPKARKSLERIREACDVIETAGGTISYARVGAMATAKFGGPKAQTIFNNKIHREYIDLRRGARGPCAKNSLKVRKTAEAKLADYPAAGLDSKTRACIDLLRASVARLERDVAFLAKTNESLTMRKPISFKNAFAAGATKHGGLDVNAGVASDLPPKALLRALEVVLSGKIMSFQVEVRGEHLLVSCMVDGRRDVLMTPAQARDAIEWVQLHP